MRMGIDAGKETGSKGLAGGSNDWECGLPARLYQTEWERCDR